MAAVVDYKITPASASHYYYYTCLMDDFPNFGPQPPFDLSDYILQLDEAGSPVDECLLPIASQAQVQAVSPPVVAEIDIDIGTTTATSATVAATQLANTNSVEGRGGGGGGGLIRVAFRTKSEVEVLDDGFKWRKYGKKSVKNSPNPRNYYRCSTEGCSVKKRVERDRDDPSYVITTYDGVHNHTSADVVYYATQDDISGQFVVSGCYGNGITPNS